MALVPSVSWALGSKQVVSASGGAKGGEMGRGSPLCSRSLISSVLLPDVSRPCLGSLCRVCCGPSMHPSLGPAGLALGEGWYVYAGRVGGLGGSDGDHLTATAPTEQSVYCAL